MKWVNTSRMLMILVSLKSPESQLFNDTNIIKIREILLHFIQNHSVVLVVGIMDNHSLRVRHPLQNGYDFGQIEL